MYAIKKLVPTSVKLVAKRLAFFLSVIVTRCRYAGTLRRLRKKIKHAPLRVVFLVDDTSKWKTQSLFDILARDSHYLPIVAKAGIYSEQEKSNSVEMFFAEKGIFVSNAYVCSGTSVMMNPDLHPDIVIYQHPWGQEACLSPVHVAKAGCLTAYVPYYVPNYGAIHVDCQLDFHRTLWRYFVLNETWASLFRRSTTALCRAGRFIATGHTMLDYFFLMERTMGRPDHNENLVIYAPHWSFNHPLNYPEHSEKISTFLWNGKEILRYAQEHPEINWIFKPHPRLRKALIDSKVMTEEEVDAYYHAWEKCGAICLDGNYMDLFMRSKTMITDCGSFLVEYLCTGKPIIRLVSDDSVMIPLCIQKKLFEQFYDVHNLKEMYKVFDLILFQNNDYMLKQRIATLKEYGLCGQNAALNILKHMNGELGRR